MFHVVYSRHYWDTEDQGTFESVQTLYRNVPYSQIGFMNGKCAELKEKADKDRKVFFVYGGTDVDDREKIRHIVEQNENAIIIASYGTFSTGVSIRKLHNIIFASPSKSRIRVLQSIDRQLRKSNSKEVAKLYDIGDDLSWKSYKNHTLRHFTERIKIYDAEKFNYKPVIVKL